MHDDEVNAERHFFIAEIPFFLIVAAAAAAASGDFFRNLSTHCATVSSDFRYQLTSSVCPLNIRRGRSIENETSADDRRHIKQLRRQDRKIRRKYSDSTYI